MTRILFSLTPIQKAYEKRRVPAIRQPPAGLAALTEVERADGDVPCN
jgi:hypothetical protein